MVQQPLMTGSVALSWSLQSALIGGLAVTSAVMAKTFRRPAMWALAAFFAIGTAASIMVWVSLSAQELGLPTGTAFIVAAIGIGLGPGASSVVIVHLLRIVAGRETRGLPSLMVAGTATAVAAMAAYTPALLVPASVDLPVASIGVFGSLLAIISFLSLAVYALRLRKTRPERATVFNLIATAQVLLAMRSSVNLIVAGIAFSQRELPKFPSYVTATQVFLLAIAGVLQFVAVLDEERMGAVAQAEHVSKAEAAMASSQRLESLGRMAGAVAHDFNNLLAVVSLSAQSAQSSPADAEGDLKEILDASRRGQELTRQLLAFARQSPQEITRFDVSHQVDKMQGLVQRMAGKSAILKIVPAAAPQLVEMDVTQFEQVVMNLVVNARDAMPRGGTITVQVADRVGAGHADGAMVKVSVSDTGSGIEPDVLPHIFEPFFSTKAAGEGTGLGLATCDAIVRRAGGRIDVNSVLGRGTQFDVLLPRARASAA